MRKVFTMRRGAFVLFGVLMMAGAGLAYAYFAGNTATTHAVVASPSAFSIVVDQTPTGAALTPGGPSQTYGWSIYNNTSTPEMMSSVTASVTSDANGGILNEAVSPAVYVDGCLASWFTATIDQTGLGLPFMLNGNGGLEGPTSATSPNALTVTMSASASDQDACRGVEPQIVMTVT